MYEIKWISYVNLKHVIHWISMNEKFCIIIVIIYYTISIKDRLLKKFC